MTGHAGKEPPGRIVPWWAVAVWNAWDFITWPRTVRELKRAGCRRTGWMAWETGPENWVDNDVWGDDPPGEAACYRSPIGVMVHGPGCTCPEWR